MNISEMAIEAKRERDELVTRIEALRKQREQVNHDIKIAVTELARTNRVVAALEGRKRKDGGSQ